MENKDILGLKKELELVEKAKTNINDFSKLYDYYYNRILNFCFSRLMNKELAEDITAYTFVKAIENIKYFDTSEQVRFGSWLYKVANNRIMDYLRKGYAQKFIELDEELEKINFDFEREMSITQASRQIAFVLSKLKNNYQQIIVYRFYAQLEIDEISRIMRIKKARVSVILHRALGSFRKKYQKFYPESEIFDLL